jgi:hypothetical protein
MNVCLISVQSKVRPFVFVIGMSGEGHRVIISKLFEREHNSGLFKIDFHVDYSVV